MIIGIIIITSCLISNTVIIIIISINNTNYCLICITSMIMMIIVMNIIIVIIIIVFCLILFHYCLFCVPQLRSHVVTNPNTRPAESVPPFKFISCGKPKRKTKISVFFFGKTKKKIEFSWKTTNKNENFEKCVKKMNISRKSQLRSV